MFKYMKVSFNMLISQMQSFLALSYNAWGKKKEEPHFIANYSDMPRNRGHSQHPSACISHP